MTNGRFIAHGGVPPKMKYEQCTFLANVESGRVRLWTREIEQAASPMREAPPYTILINPIYIPATCAGRGGAQVISSTVLISSGYQLSAAHLLSVNVFRTQLPLYQSLVHLP